jgi:hypothetical protein
MIDPNDDQIIRPREFLIGGAFVVIVVAFITLVLVIHGFSSEGSGSDLQTPSPSPSPVPTASPTPGTSPAESSSPGETAAPGDTTAPSDTGDDGTPGPADARIEQLARDSIEFLPAGRWPELYDEFVASFADRCTREEFEEAGEEGAAAVGSNLNLLGFVRLDNLVINGDRATASIVGEIRGQSEYTVAAAFAFEGGEWKLAPAAGTSGCSAFNRTSG